ncbi:MAG: DUF3291 domain-containing protein [Pseudomonadota bacterium]
MKQPDNTHLAELNVATALDELDSARLADFMAALDKINGIAERSPGYVWRLTDEGGDATSIRVSDDPRFIVNLSVWETVEAFEHFVWNTVHRRVYQKRTKWFEAPKTPNLVMWWIPAGQLPSLEEAMAKLAQLTAEGPSEEAFGWESLENIQLWKQQRCA